MPAFSMDIFGQSIEPKKVTKTTKSYSCLDCGRDLKCKSPKIGVFGEGLLRILLVGSCNTKHDDLGGLPLSEAYGRLIKTALYKYDVDMTRDCYRVNLVRCYSEKEPDNFTYKCCDKFLVEDIERLKPSLIICFGSEAINSVLRPETLDKFSVNALHGKVIPHQRWGCYVGCMFDPDFIFKTKNKEQHIFCNDMGNILSYIGKELPKPLEMSGNTLITNVDEAMEILDIYSESENPVAFDYETSAFDPYQENSDIYTVALCNDIENAFCIPIGVNTVFNPVQQAFLQERMQKFLGSNCPKIVQNFNMEHSWSVRKYQVEPKNVIWDTMNSYHVANSRKEMTALGKQVYEMVGYEYKDMVDYKDLLSDIKNTSNYNCLDVRYTLMAYLNQKALIKEKGLEDFNLMYSKAIYPLARFRDRGIRVDVNQFKEFKVTCNQKEQSILDLLYQNEAIKKYEVKYGEKFNLNSPDQIGKVLFEIIGEKCEKFTKGKVPKYSTDEEALTTLLPRAKHEDTKKLIQSIFDLRKNDAFLNRVVNWEKFLDKDGYVHPSYLLNTALSFRSSAADPTSQNVPKHDDELKQFRKAMIPKNDCILEFDLSAGEVRGIAMASDDEVLIKEILDGYDSHRYWASLLYDKKMEDITKDERFNAKNKFVFPSYYGSEPKAESANLDLPLKHVQRVFDMFWQKYQGVRRWQQRVIDFYNKHGYIVGMSGFRCSGPLTLFQLYNIPNQGSTFHLVLSALDPIERVFEENKFVSYPYGEIHDAVLFDTKYDEVEQIVEKVTPIICGKRFSWQKNVPINIDWMIGKNSLDMELLCKC